MLAAAGAAGLWLRSDDRPIPAPQQPAIPVISSTSPAVAPRTTLDKYRIAVLPFANISADPADEYFSDGMTEELISKLSRLHDLTVIARTSIMQYKETGKSIAEIGRELQVGTILEGSVRKAGDRLRITAQLAFSYDVLAEYGYLPPDEAFPKVKEAARRALEIDATTAEAHTALAVAASYYDYDWIRADESFRRALELNPNSVVTYDWYGVIFLNSMGRHQEAIAHNKRAKELDPLTPYIRADLGWAYNHARRWDEAIAECDQIPEIDPHFYFTYWCLGFAYWQKGMLEEAVAAYEGGLDLEPSDAGLKADLAIVYAAVGKQDLAQGILKEFEQRARREYVPPFAFAVANMAAGNLDRTFAWLDRMYEERAPWLILMNEHARYDRLRGDRRFQQLLRKIGFK